MKENKLKYRILIQWSDEDGCYLASLPDLSPSQKWVTHGETYQEALENAIDAMEELVSVSEKQGETLPPIPALKKETTEELLSL